MQYVVNTIHTSDCLEIRESCNEELRPQNESNLPTHSTSVGAGNVVASDCLLIGSLPPLRKKAPRCNAYKGTLALNCQHFLKSRKIFDLLTHAVIYGSYYFPFPSGKKFLGGERLDVLPASDSCRWALYYLNLATSLIRVYAPYFTTLAQSWLTNNKLVTPSNTPYNAAYRAFLWYGIKFSRRMGARVLVAPG